MSRKLKLLSLDVQGLHDLNRRRALFSHLKEQKASVCCLQETYSLPEDEKMWCVEWGGKIFCSHGTVTRKRFAFHPTCTFHLYSVQTDPQGDF